MTKDMTSSKHHQQQQQIQQQQPQQQLQQQKEPQQKLLLQQRKQQQFFVVIITLLTTTCVTGQSSVTWDICQPQDGYISNSYFSVVSPNYPSKAPNNGVTCSCLIQSFNRAPSLSLSLSPTTTYSYEVTTNYSWDSYTFSCYSSLQFQSFPSTCLSGSANSVINGFVSSSPNLLVVYTRQSSLVGKSGWFVAQVNSTVTTTPVTPNGQSENIYLIACGPGNSQTLPPLPPTLPPPTTTTTTTPTTTFVESTVPTTTTTTPIRQNIVTSSKHFLSSVGLEAAGGSSPANGSTEQLASVSSDDELSVVGTVVGSVLGLILFFVIVIIIVFVLLRLHRDSKGRKATMTSVTTSTTQSTQSFSNPSTNDYELESPAMSNEYELENIPPPVYSTIDPIYIDKQQQQQQQEGPYASVVATGYGLSNKKQSVASSSTKSVYADMSRGSKKLQHPQSEYRLTPQMSLQAGGLSSYRGSAESERNSAGDPKVRMYLDPTRAGSSAVAYGKESGGGEAAENWGRACNPYENLKNHYENNTLIRQLQLPQLQRGDEQQLPQLQQGREQQLPTQLRDKEQQLTKQLQGKEQQLSLPQQQHPQQQPQQLPELPVRRNLYSLASDVLGGHASDGVTRCENEEGGVVSEATGSDSKPSGNSNSNKSIDSSCKVSDKRSSYFVAQSFYEPFTSKPSNNPDHILVENSNPNPTDHILIENHLYEPLESDI